MKRVHLIINGKADPSGSLADTVYQILGGGVIVEECITSDEIGAEQFAREACRRKADLVIAGGGDGTLGEVVNGIFLAGGKHRPALGILPLGTANDFARSCDIPAEVEEALRLALTGTPTPIDIGKANDRFFLNVVSGGFGAEVTSSTPPVMKWLLGSTAYAVMGAIMFLGFRPYEGHLITPEGEEDGPGYALAVCNGRQAGGGRMLAPEASLRDGLLDVMVVRDFPLDEVGTLIDEMGTLPEDGDYVTSRKMPWLEVHSTEEFPLSLDGELVRFRSVRFEILPAALPVVLPPGCPLLGEGK